MNMRTAKIGGMILVCLMMFVGGYVLAQDTPAKAKDKELADILYKVLLNQEQAQLFALDPKGHPDMIHATSDLAEAYGKGTAKRPFVEAMVSSSLSDYYKDKTDARSAVQLSNVHEKVNLDLSLIQTMQNQRIIELLEQIAQNKK